MLIFIASMIKINKNNKRTKMLTNLSLVSTSEKKKK